MRITFVTPYAGLAGGIRVVAIYAERLSRLGHEVFLVSKPMCSPTWKQQIKSLIAGKGLIQHPKMASHFDAIDVPHKVIDKSRPYVEEDVPDSDVIIATWWQTAEEIAAFPPSKGEKFYFIQLDETFEGQPEQRVKATYRMPFRKITISKILLDLMTNEYGDQDVSLVLNSVDTQQFHAPKRRKQDIPTIGFLYSSTFHKGCDVVFEAIEIISRQLPELRILAFGTEQPDPNLPLPLGTEYICQPAQDKIKDIYAQCDVWLCGSRREGFHLPPLEAMACRTPVVSTAVGGPLDTIENGVNGYLVPLEDAESLADRVMRVLTLDQQSWQTVSDAAYATAVSYSWDDATKLFEAALLRVVYRDKAMCEAIA